MRIVHYLGQVRLERGGVVRTVLDVCALLAEAGHDVDLICYDEDGAPPEWRAGIPGMPSLIVLPHPERPLGFFGRASVAALTERLSTADVVHLHGIWVSSNVQIAALARRLGTPYVVSMHGMLDDWSMSVKTPKKHLFLAAMGRGYLRRAAEFHFTSKMEQRESLARFPHPASRVIPCAMDLTQYESLPGAAVARQAFDLGDAGSTVLFLSRLHPVKGVDLLIDAVARCRAAGMDLNLVIAGTGDDAYADQLRRHASRSGIETHIKFIGFVSGPEKASLIEAADLFCLPSKHENFGLAWAEALACRTPVLTTRGVGVWKELEESGGAMIVDRTAEALAEGIQTLWSDPAELSAMGERGRTWVRSFLDRRRVVDAYHALYKDVQSA